MVNTIPLCTWYVWEWQKIGLLQIEVGMLKSAPPLNSLGLISDMYTGAETIEKPIPIPKNTRSVIKMYQVGVNAETAVSNRKNNAAFV